MCHHSAVLRMGTLVEEAIRQASRALTTHDAALALDVIQGDPIINETQRAVSRLISVSIATQAEGPTELGGIAHTRRQESDRIAAVAAAITALGGRATAFADAIRIEPVPLRGGVVSAAGDHRIAMAFSILGLEVPGVAIDGAETVTKTFPDFYAMVRELGR